MYKFEQWARENLTIYNDSTVEFKIQCLNPNHPDQHPSAYFNVEKGVWHCFSCHAKGSIEETPEMLDVFSKIRATKRRLAERKLPKEQQLVLSESVLDRYNNPTDYWSKRGIDEETIELFQLGYDPFLNAVTIPARDIDGNLLGVTRRFLSDDHIGPRYKNPYKFPSSSNLFAAWLGKDYDMTTVCLHEGAIDAMRLWQLRHPALSFSSSAINGAHVDILIKLGVRRVIYFGDSDIPGMQAKQRARGMWIQSDNTYRYKKETDLSQHFLVYEVTDFSGKKDAGAMTDEQILKALDSKVLYRFNKKRAIS